MASLGKVFTLVTIFHRQNMVSPVMSLVTIVRWVDNALAKVGGILTGFEDIGLHINIGCKIFVRTLAYIGYKGLSILDSCNVKSCTM